jgi:hypothetical protein
MYIKVERATGCFQEGRYDKLDIDDEKVESLLY